MKSVKWILPALLLLTLAACEHAALMFTPKKEPVTSHSKLALQAEGNFWKTLHQGNYKNITSANELLMAAYLENPNDPALAAHLGFLHIWKITERQRDAEIPADIVNQIVLSKKYFADAVELNPGDARFRGFLGDSQLVSGQIFADQREQVRGYYTIKQAIHDWPEFNYFTGGYVMSTLPATSSHFKEGLAWQWKTLDLCAGEKVDRGNPDFSRYLSRETLTGNQRACWNSWIAPYNFEGFFLNMGDMLVKSGDWQTAQKIYHNATLAKNYSSWPYRMLLEGHNANARQNTVYFQKLSHAPDKTIMFNSGYGCVACHQLAKN
jgi:hypothetical protein